MTDYQEYWASHDARGYIEDGSRSSSAEEMVATLLEAETFGPQAEAPGTDFPLGMDSALDLKFFERPKESVLTRPAAQRGHTADARTGYYTPPAPVFSLFSSPDDTGGRGADPTRDWNMTVDPVLPSRFSQMGSGYETDKPSGSGHRTGTRTDGLSLSVEEDPRTHVTTFLNSHRDAGGPHSDPPTPNSSYALYGEYRGLSAQTLDDSKVFAYRAIEKHEVHAASSNRTWSSPSSPSGYSRSSRASSEHFPSPRSVGPSYHGDQHQAQASHNSGYTTYDVHSYRHSAGIEQSAALLPPPGYTHQPSRRHSTIEAFGYNSALDPVSVQRSHSLDNVLDDHKWSKMITQHHQSHVQHGAGSVPSIRLHSGYVPSHNGSGYHDVSQRAPLHINTHTHAHHSSLGSMSPLAPGSPTSAARQAQLQQAHSHASTSMMHAHSARIQQYGSRVSAPIATSPTAASSPASAHSHMYMMQTLGVRVPTTVLVPGLGLRMVDMVLSPPAVPFNGQMLRSPYDTVLMPTAGHGQEPRSGRMKDGTRRDETKDIGMESADGYIYQVQFKRAHRNFLLGPSAPRDVTVGDYVKVEADRGEDLGVVIGKVTASAFNEEKHTAGFKGRGFSYHQSEAKRIIRLANDDEKGHLSSKALEEEKVLAVCREKVENRGLPMKVIDAEYQFDRHKLTFFFEADRRIDFRELVRDLFALYKTRIWLQQVDAPSGGDKCSLPDAFESDTPAVADDDSTPTTEDGGEDPANDDPSKEPENPPIHLAISLDEQPDAMC